MKSCCWIPSVRLWDALGAEWGIRGGAGRAEATRTKLALLVAISGSRSESARPQSFHFMLKLAGFEFAEALQSAPGVVGAPGGPQGFRQLIVYRRFRRVEGDCVLQQRYGFQWLVPLELRAAQIIQRAPRIGP